MFRDAPVAVLALVFGLPWTLGACDSNAPRASVYAKDYDRHCATVADCAAVTDGPIGCCGDTTCPTAAIRQDALAKYTSAREPTAAMCTPRPPCASPIRSCLSGRVTCMEGLCELLVPDAATAD